MLDAALAQEALQRGFPRLVLLGDEDGEARARLAPWLSGPVPVVTVSVGTRAAWDQARRGMEIPPARAEYWARRVGEVVAGGALRSTWVDRTLGDLSKAAGAPLPAPFRGMARRVLEHPARYQDLHGLAELSGLSRGALKARFRRRDLPSPWLYVRWLRTLATARVLSDPETTTFDASVRLGFTSPGNLCRTIRTVTGLTPSALRDTAGWHRVLAGFVAECLAPSMLDAWDSLDDVFLRRVA